MALYLEPQKSWAILHLTLSPTDTFKMARLGGMPVDEAFMVDTWQRAQHDRSLRAALREAAAFGAHIVIGDMLFEDIFDNPSPFITDDSF